MDNMKYGLIKNGCVCEILTTDTQGNWLSGNIAYDANNNRLTAQEMIAKHSLKPITLPVDFNGRYGDYSFVESDTDIIIGALTKAAREGLQAAKTNAIRRQREKECFAIINRGSPWYDLLSLEQREDLNAWYIAWLNATETNIIPTVPESLAEVLK